MKYPLILIIIAFNVFILNNLVNSLSQISGEEANENDYEHINNIFRLREQKNNFPIILSKREKPQNVVKPRQRVFQDTYFNKKLTDNINDYENNHHIYNDNYILDNEEKRGEEYRGTGDDVKKDDGTFIGQQYSDYNVKNKINRYNLMKAYNIDTPRIDFKRNDHAYDNNFIINNKEEKNVEHQNVKEDSDDDGTLIDLKNLINRKSSDHVAPIKDIGSKFVQNKDVVYNGDMCKIYNENLIKVWSLLSKYLNITNESELDIRNIHNLILLIKDFLKQHDEVKNHSGIEVHEQQSENLIFKTDTKEAGESANVMNIFLQINGLFNETGKNAVDVNEMVNLIYTHIRPFILKSSNEPCTNYYIDYLIFSLTKSYEQYLNTTCKNSFGKDDPSLMLELDQLAKATRNLKTKELRKLFKSISTLRNDIGQTRDLQEHSQSNEKHIDIVSLADQMKKDINQLDENLPSTPKKKDTSFLEKPLTDVSNYVTHLKRLKEYCEKFALNRFIDSIKTTMKHLKNTNCKELLNLRSDLSKGSLLPTSIENTQNKNIELSPAALLWLELPKSLDEYNRLAYISKASLLRNVSNTALQIFYNDVSRLRELVDSERKSVSESEVLKQSNKGSFALNYIPPVKTKTIIQPFQDFDNRLNNNLIIKYLRSIFRSPKRVDNLKTMNRVWPLKLDNKEHIPIYNKSNIFIEPHASQNIAKYDTPFFTFFKKERNLLKPEIADMNVIKNISIESDDILEPLSLLKRLKFSVGRKQSELGNSTKYDNIIQDKLNNKPVFGSNSAKFSDSAKIKDILVQNLLKENGDVSHQIYKLSTEKRQNLNSVKDTIKDGIKKLFNISHGLLTKSEPSNDFDDKLATKNYLDLKNIKKYALRQLKLSPPKIYVYLPPHVSQHDTNQLIELTYALHYPQLLLYQPYLFIKHQIPYDYYIKNKKRIINVQEELKDDQLKLLNVVKLLPNNRIELLYRNNDFNAFSYGSVAENFVDDSRLSELSSESTPSSKRFHADDNFVNNYYESIKNVTDIIDDVENDTSVNSDSGDDDSKENSKSNLRKSELNSRVTSEGLILNFNGPAKSPLKNLWNEVIKKKNDNSAIETIESVPTNTDGKIVWNNYPIAGSKYSYPSVLPRRIFRYPYKSQGFKDIVGKYAKSASRR